MKKTNEKLTNNEISIDGNQGTSITLPLGVTSIGVAAFYGRTKLHTIFIDTVNDDEFARITDLLPYDLRNKVYPNFRSITLPQVVTSSSDDTPVPSRATLFGIVKTVTDSAQKVSADTSASQDTAGSKGPGQM